MLARQTSKVKFPDKIAPILTPAPYKVLWGGRGKGASWGFARAAILLGANRKLFIVCAREVQKSIKDSVHKLLSDQIEMMGYGSFYDILDTEIRGKNGTVFSFVGLNNIDSLKSMEAIDILWVTEARRIPKSKWYVLLPTVRRDPPFGPFKKGSEIWIDFNPELASDDTYVLFVANPPAGAIVIHLTFRDNPWFPKVLRDQKEEMRLKDYDEYLTTWEGRTRKTLSGAIYAKELAAAILDNRVTPHIRHMASKGVIASFDLGDSDATAMWVWQQIGNDHNAIFYHEETGQPIEYFIKLLLERKYVVRGLWLPHDADQAHQSARKLVHNTIAKQARALLPTPGIVKVVPNVSEVIQINATRSLFPRININEVDCSAGVMTLQHYQYEVDQDAKTRSAKPLHNWASHGAKAFGYYAVQLREGNKRDKQKDTGTKTESNFINHNQAQGWMG